MIYLTVLNNSGGNHGHQLKDLIGGMTIAKAYKFTYAHTDYPYLEFAGLGEGEIEVEDLPKDIEKVQVSGPAWRGLSFQEASSIFKPIQSNFRQRDCLIVLENAVRIHPCQTINWYKLRLIDTEVFAALTKSISLKYYNKHKNRPLPFKKDEINIAVHINRGVDYRNWKPDRGSSRQVRYIFDLDYFDNIITQLQSVFGTRPHTIRLYTEKLNSEEITKRFSNRKAIRLCVGDNRQEKHYTQIYDIFLQMIASDILVMSNSSFSVMAGHFKNPGVSIYHPHRHFFDAPKEQYIATDQHGNFDIGSLLEAMDRNIDKLHWRFT